MSMFLDLHYVVQSKKITVRYSMLGGVGNLSLSRISINTSPSELDYGLPRLDIRVAESGWKWRQLTPRVLVALREGRLVTADLRRVLRRILHVSITGTGADLGILLKLIIPAFSVPVFTGYVRYWDWWRSISPALYCKCAHFPPRSLIYHVDTSAATSVKWRKMLTSALL